MKTATARAAPRPSPPANTRPELRKPRTDVRRAAPWREIIVGACLTLLGIVVGAWVLSEGWLRPQWQGPVLAGPVSAAQPAILKVAWPLRSSVNDAPQLSFDVVADQDARRLALEVVVVTDETGPRLADMVPLRDAADAGSFIVKEIDIDLSEALRTVRGSVVNLSKRSVTITVTPRAQSASPDARVFILAANGGFAAWGEP